MHTTFDTPSELLRHATYRRGASQPASSSREHAPVRSSREVTMVPMLVFGLKTIGWFDVWSFSHLISGVSVGFAVRQRNHAEIGHLLGVVGHKLH